MVVYNQLWLKNFSGNINPNTIRMKDLANCLEKYTSQYLYSYKTNIENFENVQVRVLNEHIPHLLGLSKNHCFNLPTYYSEAIFEGLKRDWTLDHLKQSDPQWFNENQYKIIGIIFLYQLLIIHNCKVYTTLFNHQRNRRLKRDNIYFVIFKYPNGVSYSIELTPENSTSSKKIFVPRSLKINDEIENDCSEVIFNFIKKDRIKSSKKKRKYIPWS